MHYTCKDCGGVSKEPKVCETNDCQNKGNELINCNCDSDEHKVEEE